METVEERYRSANVHLLDGRVFHVESAYPLGSDAGALAAGIGWLLSRQHKDGSWGPKHEGEAGDLLSTCQVLSALLEAGFPTRSTVVAQAVEYLATMPVVDRGRVWTYSRLEPFARLIDEYPEAKEVARRELTLLLSRVRQGQGPSHRFVLPILAIKAIYLMGHQQDMEAELQLCVQRSLLQWDEIDGFYKKPENAAFGLAWLSRVVWPPDVANRRREVLDRCRAMVLGGAETVNGKVDWRSGQISATSFVCISLTEYSGAVALDDQLHGLVRGGWAFLRTKQLSDGSWRGIPNESAVTLSDDYYTAVALRALLATARTDATGMSSYEWVTLLQRSDSHWRSIHDALGRQLKVTRIVTLSLAIALLSAVVALLVLARVALPEAVAAFLVAVGLIFGPAIGAAVLIDIVKGRIARLARWLTRSREPRKPPIDSCND